MEQKKIGIYGAGGFAREVAWILSQQSAFGMHMTCYISDDAHADQSLHGYRVLRFEQFEALYQGAVIAIAVGNPQTRERIADRCAASGFQFGRIEADSAQCSDSVEVGEGCIICGGSILTVDIRLGRHVHINLDCTVGHDVVMEDFVTLAPGVHVSGNVHIERGAYIGTGANIINGTHDEPLVIGAGCVIGAGACVTKSCEPHCLYAGVPAELKKRY